MYTNIVHRLTAPRLSNAASPLLHDMIAPGLVAIMSHTAASHEQAAAAPAAKPPAAAPLPPPPPVAGARPASAGRANGKPQLPNKLYLPEPIAMRQVGRHVARPGARHEHRVGNPVRVDKPLASRSFRAEPSHGMHEIRTDPKTRALLRVQTSITDARKAAFERAASPPLPPPPPRGRSLSRSRTPPRRRSYSRSYSRSRWAPCRLLPHPFTLRIA